MPPRQRGPFGRSSRSGARPLAADGHRERRRAGPARPAQAQSDDQAPGQQEGEDDRDQRAAPGSLDEGRRRGRQVVGEGGGYKDTWSHNLALVKERMKYAGKAPGFSGIDANGDGVVDGGEALANGNAVNVADIDAGRLKFKPAANANEIGRASCRERV